MTRLSTGSTKSRYLAGATYPFYFDGKKQTDRILLGWASAESVEVPQGADAKRLPPVVKPGSPLLRPISCQSLRHARSAPLSPLRMDCRPSSSSSSSSLLTRLLDEAPLGNRAPGRAHMHSSHGQRSKPGPAPLQLITSRSTPRRTSTLRREASVHSGRSPLGLEAVQPLTSPIACERARKLLRVGTEVDAAVPQPLSQGGQGKEESTLTEEEPLSPSLQASQEEVSASDGGDGAPPEAEESA